MVQAVGFTHFVNDHDLSAFWQGEGKGTLYQVCSQPHVKGPAVVTGAGQSLGIQAALRTNLPILNAEAFIPDVVKKHFPAYAAAKDLAIYLSCL